MKTTQLRGYVRRHWEKIKVALREGTHKPLPVRRTEIPGDTSSPTILSRSAQAGANPAPSNVDLSLINFSPGHACLL